jgi:putative copper resistance protein D
MSWDIASLLAKVIIFMAMASVVGGIFCLYLTMQSHSQIRQSLLKYILTGALAGAFASSIYFFIQVGTFSQAGLGGMLDRMMLTILAQSDLGYASISRLAAFALTLVLVGYKKLSSKKVELRFGYFAIFILATAGLLLAYSFSLIGHVATLNLIARFVIGLHVFAISLWLGSLYPLWYLCKVEETEKLQKLMQRFGELAIVFVAVLILSGVYLLTQILDSPTEIISTSYGLILLFKLAGVSVLLLLGALNKLRLVPRLSNENGVLKLKGSITLEMVIAFIVLMITAYLTTLVGLNHAG